MHIKLSVIGLILTVAFLPVADGPDRQDQGRRYGRAKDWRQRSA